MNKLIIVIALLIGSAWCRVDYVNTTTNGTNVLTNMLLDAGYLTNVGGGGSGETNATINTIITLRGNAYIKTNITGFLSPSATSIKNVSAYATIAPTGSDILIDFSVGGSSIFTSTNGALHITNTTTSNGGIAPTQNSNVGIGNPIYVTIHQAGTTIPGGSDLLILIEYN